MAVRLLLDVGVPELLKEGVAVWLLVPVRLDDGVPLELADAVSVGVAVPVSDPLRVAVLEVEAELVLVRELVPLFEGEDKLLCVELSVREAVPLCVEEAEFDCDDEAALHVNASWARCGRTIGAQRERTELT